MILKEAIESGKKFKRASLKWLTIKDNLAGLSWNDVCATDWVIEDIIPEEVYMIFNNFGRHDSMIYASEGQANESLLPNEYVVKMEALTKGDCKCKN